MNELVTLVESEQKAKLVQAVLDGSTPRQAITGLGVTVYELFRWMADDGQFRRDMQKAGAFAQWMELEELPSKALSIPDVIETEEGDLIPNRLGVNKFKNYINALETRQRLLMPKNIGSRVDDSDWRDGAGEMLSLDEALEAIDRKDLVER